MTKDMEMIAICQEMRWTYFDYMNQPNWFIELVRTKMILDNERVRREMKKNQYR